MQKSNYSNQDWIIRNLFHGRDLLIATMHGKEKVIAPIFEEKLGVRTNTTQELNTDLFGTFCGEKKREDAVITTLRKKCHYALQLYGGDLVIASEGSFGNHPTIPFIPADDEFVMLIDLKKDLEIVEREISTTTNFNATELSGIIQLNEFAEKAGFPDHGLILRERKNGFSDLRKGIRETSKLHASFHEIISKYGQAFVETDMRAMHNPTRMQVIRKATEKLIDRILSTCPKCNTPGFGITSSIKGLPCVDCGNPTESIKAMIWSCNKCKYESIRARKDERIEEEPLYCGHCNP